MGRRARTSDDVCRHRPATYAMIAVSADDLVTGEVLPTAVRSLGHRGTRYIQIMQSDSACVPEDRQSARIGRVEQIAHYLLLTTDGDGGATGQHRHVDMKQAPVDRQFDPAVHEPSPAKPVGQPRSAHEIRRHVLQYACADAALDIGAMPMLDHYCVHAICVQPGTCLRVPRGLLPLACAICVPFYNCPGHPGLDDADIQIAMM
jgi:hypothetical protein